MRRIDDVWAVIRALIDELMSACAAAYIVIGGVLGMNVDDE